MTQINYQNNLKLLDHLDRLDEWKKGGNPNPIMVDMDLSNACNHSCPGCVGSKNVENEFIPFLEKDHVNNDMVPYVKAKDWIDQFAVQGVKSIIFGGGGDPSMHPKFAELVRYVKSKGIEIAVNTNGMRMLSDSIEAMVNNCTWVRISIDADSPEIYKLTHGMHEKKWEITLNNIKRLVYAKNSIESNTVIGLTYLLGPHTKKGIYNASVLAKELGVNYIRFRPFFNWGDEIKWQKEDIEKILSDLEDSKRLNTEDFQVNYAKDRLEAMANKPHKRIHKKCYIHHFVTSISPDGKMAPCCLMKNNSTYELGDLNNNSFNEIWDSKERVKAYSKIDFSDCPQPCMQEDNNEFLWELKNDKPHNNFL